MASMNYFDSRRKNLHYNTRIFMFYIYTTVLYAYINSFRNDVYDLFFNTHVQIKIYREFYHCIIYIANNEGRHVRIKDKHSCEYKKQKKFKNDIFEK
jgi:hypothetical protein